MSQPGKSQRERRLDEVVTAYLQEVERGGAPDPAEWLARYPDLAAELAAFFAAQQQVDQLAAPLRASAPHSDPGTVVHTPTPETASPKAILGTVRYVGDYELREEIARGGMGVVYKARQVSLNRIVALKMILAGRLASEADVRRFRAEAEAAANLQHPNIVAIHEVGEHEGQHYFSMDYVDGTSLAALVRQSPLPARRAARYVQVISEAIDFAHQKGTLHRDLKPSNVLIDAHDQPRVTDFGLAKRVQGEPGASTKGEPGASATGGLTATGQILGTPSYMAPEQASGQKGVVGPPADVYSLGAVLYELLTGRPPFQAETPLDVLLQVLESEPVPPRLLNPRLPRDLETITLKCLQKEPRRRYPTAGALADDLGRFLRGEAIRARPVGPLGRLGRWCRRNPLVAGLLAAVALALLAGTAVSLYFAVRADASAQLAKDEAGRADGKAADATRAQKRTRLHLHVALTQLAQNAWRDNAIARLLQLLDEQRPGPGQDDLRGFEWYYLWRLCHSERRTLTHKHALGSVAYSPDGTRLATATRHMGGPDEVKIWDARSGKEVRRLTGHGEPISCVTFSKDGRRLATASWDRTIKVWDAQTGKQLLTITTQAGRAQNPAGGRVQSVAFSPDGKYLASQNWDQTVKLWDARTGTAIRTVYQTPKDSHFLFSIGSVAFSADGKRLATGGAPGPKVWDLATGAEAFPLIRQKGLLNEQVSCIAFSPDGKQLAAATGTDNVAPGRVKVWDAQTGKELRTLTGHGGSISCLAYSRDSRLLATAGADRTVRIWDAQTGRELRTLKGHTGEVNSVAFNHDGALLASAGDDKTVKIWDAHRDQEALTLGGLVTGGVAFSPDGKRLAATSQDPIFVRIWDSRTGHELTPLQAPRNERTGNVRAVAWSPDGRRIATDSGTRVKLWDARTGKELHTLAGHRNSVWSLAFSPDSRRLASGAAGPGVRIWDVAGGRELTRFQPGNSVTLGLAFSPDGKRLATGGWSRRRANGDWETPVCVSDAESGREFFACLGHSSSVTSVAFSRDGRRLASGSQDQTVKIWDAETGAELLTLKGHTGEVTSVAFNHDGRRLASSGKDQTAKIWDTVTGHELLTLKGHAFEVRGVAFSPDGHRLASCSPGVVKLWDATPAAD